jgi:predicted 3-demethylubiquinone-9 3-methyltransferase (glyoxalase superfamily)/uncharacterized protein YndB with AHSA1/START domain
MTPAGSLQLATRGEREIIMTRAFAAPRPLVFKAFTTPELLKRWLLGPDGWSLVVCDIDLRVGGTYRYVWRHDRDKTEMGMGGVYREIVAPERIVSTEQFDTAWYPGEAVGTLVLTERGDTTVVTQTMLYASREARDGILKSGMERGVAASYDRLERLLASTTMQKIVPFLWFNGQAEAATNFYVSIFKNSKVVNVARAGGAVMSTTFELDGQRFYALNGGPQFTFTEAISFFVNCETQAEVDDLWTKLTDGGTPQQCGWLKDRYGVSWQIIPSVLGKMLQDEDPAKAGRVMQAMLGMEKISIEGLERAYRG